MHGVLSIILVYLSYLEQFALVILQSDTVLFRGVSF